MGERPILRFASRGWRDLPSPSTRVRGSGELPYNPNRPLTLPGDRRQRRRPQFRMDLVARLLLPLLALGGIGVGVFFGVSALLDDDNAAAPAATSAAASGDAASTDVAALPAPGSSTNEAAAVAPTPTATDGAATDIAATDAGAAGPIDADQAAAVEAAAAAAPAEAVVGDSAGVITEAQLNGAPALLDRGGATPIPSGVSGLALADGTLYDPSDETAALSSVWPAGTVLEITRLPGGPLLSDEDAAALIGKTIQVLVVGNGDFPTEIQLSPAAYQRIARDFEPIIALRIAAVAAPDS